MKNAHYHINLFWSDEDGCWIADVPDLKYCSAHGDTPDEAIASIQEAIEGWLETARDSDLPIPEARYRPAIYA
ncbi:MAG: type II toxin-antitoxin system HicB family antitoxin [Erythrobacter sp.]|uniref:type II toxin-antitoxin system HicB family antitoxin n=1 Tax=Erythrobacter sp. TaxID=1042 RepID=UPI00261FF91C|nr:type II toxin-antitoxin system HicB family antitoxin [Erythrobacter sp.]MDJ0978727.1 type II toxin-antitoxin system HicB family antitoxin [Erythrobacter sp.]